MPSRAIYKPVSNGGASGRSSGGSGSDDENGVEGPDENDVVVFTIDDGDDEDEHDMNDCLHIGEPPDNGAVQRQSDSHQQSSESRISSFELEAVHPMDVSTYSFSDDDLSEQLFNWKDPWVPSILITLTLTTPILLGNAYLFYSLTGVSFAATPFLAHWLVVLSAAHHLASAKLSTLTGTPSRLYVSVVSLVEIVLLSQAYPRIWKVLLDEFFTEIDGTSSIEWVGYKRQLELHQVQAYTAVALRTLVGVNAIGLRFATAAMDSSFSDTPTWRDRYCTCPSYIVAPFLYLDSRVLQKLVRCCCSVTSSYKRRIRRQLQYSLLLAIVAALLVFIMCLASASRHLGSWTAPRIKSNVVRDRCDPLDETECWLPFPSFHALQRDNTTATGWRVHLQGDLLPPLKRRGAHIQPDFLNELDGFSTMAPMMFYINGLREAHEAGRGQLKSSYHIAESITELSATLLLDVVSSTLIPHTAEIDYLDNDRPMILLFPARPLHHNRHYAVAVVNAKNAKGVRLEPTNGMKRLLFNTTSEEGSLYDTDRRQRYVNVLIPALERAAPWFHFDSDPTALQLLFDFHTISEESQLGPVRAVRDATLRRISSPAWDWHKHVRTNRQVDYDCNKENTFLARTVHAELDVPWFLNRQGSGARSAILDKQALAAKAGSEKLGVAKFLLHIPCSLRAAALNGASDSNSKPLRAVMEFGHGLFGNRDEASEDFHVRMAHDQGYMIMAMDWRGMSSYDLLVVVKVLISTPRLFEAVRDNLIQGFACKYALQHFARNALFGRTDWLSFVDEATTGSAGASTTNTPKIIPTKDNKPPAFVYYGISQGGILGAGYVALSGATGLIDRGILGSPGTPFALILTRSLYFFNTYDKLLLVNFYTNRHVRMLLTLVQMAWDSVEASGALAPPINEPYPPVLIQTGLGDIIVTTTASEALGRAFNASTLAHAPRQVYGIPEVKTSAVDQQHLPHAILTEVMYDNEFHHLSEDNHMATTNNAIHFCLRRDAAMIAQIAEFINTGSFINPCTADGCHRDRVQC